MRSIARRIAVGAALLLVMPVAVWISGWRWQPGEQSWLLKAAFWVTETVTQPWGVITHLILFGWFLWCLLLLQFPAFRQVILRYCLYERSPDPWCGKVFC